MAIGRQPDVERLGLDHTGIAYHAKTGIVIEDTCRTTVEHIYAAGDVTGSPMTANRAMAQGRIAARNIVRQTGEEYYPEWGVEAIYTAPEVAQVVLKESDATDELRYRVHRVDYRGRLKAEITERRAGFLKLLTGDTSGSILGAAAVGSHAADLLTPIAVAIRAGLTIDELRQVAPANPTLSELIVSVGNK